jgi:hypothetical protein
MVTQTLTNIDQAIYGAVTGWAHGGNEPITRIGFKGRALVNEALTAAIKERYPSAEFQINHSGDTLKLSRDEGTAFMAALVQYRQEHMAVEGLSR